MKNTITSSRNKNRSLFATIFIVAISFTFFNCNSPNSSKVPITTNSEKALEYYMEGAELSEKLRGQEAAYFYLKAIAEDNEFAFAYFQLAIAQTTPKLVFKYLNKAKALSKNASEGEQLLILAVEAGFNNDREKQNEYYLELIEKYPNDEVLHNIYGNFLYGLPKYKSAIKHYKRSLELNPELSQPYNMLGYAYRQIGDYEAAEKYYLQYIDIIKGDPNPYDSYAELLLKKGEFEKSIEYYRKALAIQPSFIASKIGIATDLTIMEKHQEACDELASIADVSNNPGTLKRMHFAKAVVNVDRRNFERALQELKENVAISKEIEDDIALAQDLRNIGVLNIMSGNYKDALKYSEKSIEYFEKTDVSQELKYFMRRQLFITAGWVAYFENDINLLKKYKEKYKSSAQKTMDMNEIRNVHMLAGNINMLESNFEDAIYEYKQSDTENPVIVYLIGRAYEELGDYKKAQKIYSKVAHFNALSDLNYAFIRKTALEKLDEFN